MHIEQSGECVRAEGRAMDVIEVLSKSRDPFDSVGAHFSRDQVGMGSLRRASQPERNEFIDHPPLVIRFLRRFMRSKLHAELNYNLRIGDLPDGLLVAYDHKAGICYYPFCCENPKLKKRPSMLSIQRIFSEAIIDGFSPHYLKIGENYYTQFSKISQARFEREIKILSDRIHDIENMPRKRMFDFSGMPVISSF